MARASFLGRHFVITGASSGIGAAIAKELGRRGAKVGLIARRAEALEEVAAAVRAAGGEAAVGVADVVDGEALARAIGEVEAELGPCFGLIASAGVGAPTWGGVVKAERDVHTLDVNLLGAVRAIAAVQPGMMERDEGIISAVSSLAAWRGLPEGAAYSASKAGLSTFLESLRVDLSRSAIRVTTIQPGYIATPLTARNRHPMPFLMQPEEAARRIVDGLEKGKREHSFPFGMVAIGWFLRHMPNWLYDRIMRKPARKKRAAGSAA